MILVDVVGGSVVVLVDNKESNMILILPSMLAAF
jgi:hypothetical protein